MYNVVVVVVVVVEIHFNSTLPCHIETLKYLGKHGFVAEASNEIVLSGSQPDTTETMIADLVCLSFVVFICFVFKLLNILQDR